MSNNNNNNQNSGSRFPSRFSSSNNQNNQNNNNNNNNNNQNNNQRGSRFGNNPFRRFNGETAMWTITPRHKTMVRVQLNGLGDPLHRILGVPLDLASGDPERLHKRLENDESLHNALLEALEQAWATYDMQGVVMLYENEDTITRSFTQKTQPLPPPPRRPFGNSNNNNDDDEDENNNEQEDDFVPEVQCLRAIDPALVLNILARSRANILLANAPLALETGLLQQSLLTDDPRIVELANATGCLQENF
jgi:hypothetical protein